MFFIMKPSVIHLDCITNRLNVNEYFKIEHSSNFFPEWWKKLPLEINNKNIAAIQPTMKGCIGFNSFFNQGITIPLWSDFSFIKSNGGPTFYEFSDKKTEFDQHQFHQMEGYLNEKEYEHLKIISPWVFSTKQEIKWCWIQNTWALNELKEFTIPPAVVDYKYNNYTHINMFIHKNTNKSKFLISAGTPLINLIPMSDKKVKIHTHYDPDRFDAVQQLNTRFSYTKFYNKKKKLTKEKKCPFRF